MYDGKGVCYSPDIPATSADFTLITQIFDLTISRSHLPAAYFLQLKPFTQYQILFPLVPIPAGWTNAVWIQSLPKAITHDQRCENRTPESLISGQTP